MKKATYVVLVSGGICCLILMILACLDSFSKFKKTIEPNAKEWSVRYIVDESKGKLIGDDTQFVKDGENATAVKVVPAIGYRFVKWEDTGSIDANRIDFKIQSPILAVAVLEGPLICDKKFYPRDGGTIIGELYQEIPFGGSGTTVVAVPDEGYRFLKWSDGELNPIRKNENITDLESQSIYAEFIRYERTFEYEYNGASRKNEKKQVTITQDNMSEIILPVPQRDNCVFEGWYSDWHFTMKVSNEKGEIVADNDWFCNETFHGDKGSDWVNQGGKLYAKWRALNEIPTYRIFMIFVTEAHAELATYEGEVIKVDYYMSDFERRYCNQNALLVEQYLNAMFNATVNFEVESYFTTQSNVSFNQGSTILPWEDNFRYDYTLGLTDLRKGIPEVVDLVKNGNYGSVLTVFSMNDWEGKLHFSAGGAIAKYGCVHIDDVTYMHYNGSIENLFNLAYPTTYYWWENDVGLYLHEFAHTVEMQLSAEDQIANYGLHKIESLYAQQHGGIFRTDFDVLQDYLTCNFDVSGKKVGIPYEFWMGEYFKK